MDRIPDFEDIWGGKVTGTWDRRRSRIVYCSYWIDERARTVNCNDSTTLDWPVVN